ncbi:MAG TPA: multidrug DMT transporter permease [Legionella sp.]|nr:multidrug DMT transporter permease [Legionella sp.]
MLRNLILLISLFAVSPIFSAVTSPCSAHQCIAVIDAGSTGSRLHIYSYDKDDTQTPTNIHELWTNKIKPGFASIEPNAATMDAYLTSLLSLKDAPDVTIPVYFYATAGMRLLSQSRQNKYYEGLQHWFKNQSQWQLKEAKTITGNQEALFDWLSVNYYLGSLQSGQKSIGVMDMGGASVQIVFPIEKNTTLDTKSQIELDLYNHHYNLFVHSFLGLGQTEMSHQFLNSASCFANNYPLPDGESGQGNVTACEQEVSSLMNAVHRVNNLVQPLLSSNPVDSWYTMGGIANLAESKLFHFDNQQLTNQTLLQQADNQICHQQWETLNDQFPNDDYVYQYCLFSAYYFALMVDGYGIPQEQAINYIPPEKNLDWTTGVVLHHSE